MEKFVERLKMLMKENNYNNLDISKKLDIPEANIINWKLNRTVPKLDTAVKLAELFNCSLDYLFGKVNIDEATKFKRVPPFKEQLTKHMIKHNVSQYKLIKDKICHSDSFTRWFKEDCIPIMSNVIKLADYFNLSLDEFVGRV